jgi:quinohemoprotein ethanol dehydrogenase
LAAGKDIFCERCFACHGPGAVSGGVLPDLRRASLETHEMWDAIVLGGSLRDKGMPGFGQILTKEDSDAVHSFVIERARHAYENQP